MLQTPCVHLGGDHGVGRSSVGDGRVLTDELSVQTLNFTADIKLIIKNRGALFVGVEVHRTMLCIHKFVLS